MPVYNTERYLRESIDSILRQSYPYFELIVVDDGSKDGSGAIIDEYAARDSRVKVFHRDNSGVVETANFAASHATGEYIIRTDSDDISFDNKLGDLVAALEKHPGAVLASGNIEVIDDNSEYLYRHLVPPHTDEIKRAMLMYNPIANGATMIRTDAFRDVGGYSDVFAEDFHLWVKLIDKGEFVATDSALYRWRVNPDGLTMSNNKKSIAKEKEYAEIAWQYHRPTILSRKDVLDRSNYYYKRFKKHGVAYKRIFLFDLARLSGHMIRRGHIVAGSKQLIIIASTGRTGVKTVFHRIRMIIQGKSSAMLRRAGIKPSDIRGSDPTLLP